MIKILQKRRGPEAEPKGRADQYVPMFRGLRLPSVQFDYANMTDARADHADFRFATFVGARLIGASLTGSRLDGADFSGADLTNADLRDAKLEGANFLGAEIAGADLRGTDLSKALNLTTHMIESATTDATTHFPQNLD